MWLRAQGLGHMLHSENLYPVPYALCLWPVLISPYIKNKNLT